MELDN